MNLIRAPYQKYCYEISKKLKCNANMSALPELDASIHGVLVLKQAEKNSWISFVRALKPNKFPPSCSSAGREALLFDSLAMNYHKLIRSWPAPGFDNLYLA